MKAAIASIITALILVASAAAGVPDDVASLFQADTVQDARITALEKRVAKLERKTRKHRDRPPVLCRPIYGQPIPNFCR